MELMMMSSQSTISTTILKTFFHRITRRKHQHIQRWKTQMQKMMIPKGEEDLAKQNLVHVVKERETLSCISKMYGVALYEIAAANKDILDLDLIFHGQQLNIPSSVPVHTQMTSQSDDRQPKLDLYERYQSSLKVFTSLPSHHLSYARRSGHFVVVVPLIAFSIICITAALYNRVFGARDEHHPAANKSKNHHPTSKSMRWKVALSDLNPDVMADAGSTPDYDEVEDEEEDSRSKCKSSSYSEQLERDYQKFLSECGMG